MNLFIFVISRNKERWHNFNLPIVLATLPLWIFMNHMVGHHHPTYMTTPKIVITCTLIDTRRMHGTHHPKLVVYPHGPIMLPCNCFSHWGGRATMWATCATTKMLVWTLGIPNYSTSGKLVWSGHECGYDPIKYSWQLKYLALFIIRTWFGTYNLLWYNSLWIHDPFVEEMDVHIRH